MLDHKLFGSAAILAAVAILLSCPGQASAYIGPGAGLELVTGFTLPLLAFIVTTVSAMFSWPIYAVMRRIRGFRTDAVAASEGRSDQGPGNP